MPGFARGRETIPPGYVAVPIDGIGQSPTSSPVRMCAVVRRPVEGESPGSHLVEIRQTFRARVLLGCLVDARGTVLEWLEWWVQNVDRPLGFAASHRQTLGNSVADRLWAEQVDGLEAAESSSFISTGWERHHPPPIWIDLKTLSAVNLPGIEGCSSWQLCVDEAVLAQNGLSPYGTIAERYLFDPRKGSKSVFIAVTSGAIEGPNTRRLADVIAGSALEPFNAAGALMMAKSHGPMELETCSDVIVGQPWPGLRLGRSALYLLEPQSSGKEQMVPGKMSAGSKAPVADNLSIEAPPISSSDQGMLLLETHPASGRAIEGLHLKLRLLSEAIALVRRFASVAKRPLLNLSLDSFRVWFDKPSAGLPFLWTARLDLVDAGDAVDLPIDGSISYFVRGTMNEQVVTGFGSLRIREVNVSERGLTTLGLSFAPDMAMPAGKNDLVFLRLSTPVGPVDLYARPDPDRRLASSEWRLSTSPHALPGPVMRHFKELGAMPSTRVPFELVSPRSTACDLRDLGVIAIRLLLTNDSSQLRTTVDELLSLARQLSDQYSDKPLVDRILELFGGDAKWAQTLGPSRLLPNVATDSASPVPQRLWAEVLAVLVRMFPGNGPDSICTDEAQVPGGGLASVFDTTLSELSLLLMQTRSLMLGESFLNDQVRRVIQRQQASLGGGPTLTAHPDDDGKRRSPSSQPTGRIPSVVANRTK